MKGKCRQSTAEFSKELRPGHPGLSACAYIVGTRFRVLRKWDATKQFMYLLKEKSIGST